MNSDIKKDKRTGAHVDVSELSDAQLKSIQDLKLLGWEISFVRKEMFRPAVAFVHDRRDDKFMMLNPDGTYEHVSGIKFRCDDDLPEAPEPPKDIDTSDLEKSGLIKKD